MGDACCQWICDEWDTPRTGGNDIGLRLVASAITAVFSLALLFFLIYRQESYWYKQCRITFSLQLGLSRLSRIRSRMPIHRTALVTFRESPIAGLWIRIHFLRIRIQSLMLETITDPDPNPDPNPIRIQGLNDQKLKKNYN